MSTDSKIIQPLAEVPEAKISNDQIICPRCDHVMEHIPEAKEYKNREPYVCLQCKEQIDIVNELFSCEQCCHGWRIENRLCRDFKFECRHDPPHPEHGFPVIQDPENTTCGKFGPFWRGQP